jgi:hypothetical protein
MCGGVLDNGAAAPIVFRQAVNREPAVEPSSILGNDLIA